MKRKRVSRDGRVSKRIKIEPEPETTGITHPVLSHYHQSLSTLGEWLLPRSRGDLRILLRCPGKQDASTARDEQAVEEETLELLNNILVGHDEQTSVNVIDRRSAFLQFSQQLSGASMGATGSSGSSNRSNMSELVDFAMWLLFHRVYPDQQRPPHTLCHGMLRSSMTWDKGNPMLETSVPGLVAAFPNKYVEDLKSKPWSRILHHLGKRGDETMLTLLLECSMYSPMSKDQGAYSQISGIALSERRAATGAPELSHRPHRGPPSAIERSACSLDRRLSDVKLLRNRMFYARAALNAHGDVAFGLRHIHIFNRCEHLDDPDDVIHLLKYLFPRQHGLHNVFTSATDPAETVQPFHDYTLREKEIERQRQSTKMHSKLSGFPSVPKRLRGETQRLARKLLKQNVDCSYTQLLAHYCAPRRWPSSTTSDSQVGKRDFTLLATTTADVASFCKAAVRAVFPRKLLGDAETGEHNWAALDRDTDLFVKLRRFETLTLESIVKDVRLKDVAWLCPPNHVRGSRLSRSDLEKRRELMAELLYFIFDSFLIPLIRTNFHVTESGVHRNRLFYFRHDVWRRLTEPAIIQLKNENFEELGSQRSFQARSKQNLGYSHVRLLPKANGMRPITNLRRRMQIVKNGRKVMAKSINTLLAPAASVLNLERSPSNLGASLFSVSGIYPKLQSFRRSIGSNTDLKPLYFAKVDVKSCFDSLPQDALMDLIDELVQSDQYSVCRHAQIRAADGVDPTLGRVKPLKRFKSEARRGVSSTPFAEDLVAAGAKARRNTIFVDNIVPQRVSRSQVMQLMHQHVQSNVIKVGKKYYRQKRGIAQGSVVSSLLCNLLYAQMEKEHLAFLRTDTSMLLRLIDDFLLITTDEAQAKHFLQVMHRGIEAYGVSVTPDKSLVNFETCADGFRVPCLPQRITSFPYCGLMIDTKTLNISKDSARVSKLAGADGLTVDLCRTAGSTFCRKMVMGLKIQLHTMLIDTSYNSVLTVWRNLYSIMADVANKMLHYSICLPKTQRLSPRMLIRATGDMLSILKAMTGYTRHQGRSQQYDFEVSEAAVRWITALAFGETFASRQTGCSIFLGWLRSMGLEAKARLKSGELRLQAQFFKSFPPA